jgi:hypothetical protein
MNARGWQYPSITHIEIISQIGAGFEAGIPSDDPSNLCASRQARSAA